MILRFLIRKFGAREVGRIRSSVRQYVQTQLKDVLVATEHSPYLTRHRIDAIVMRTRMVAAAFSLLTFLWIGLDAFTLPWPEWGVLGCIRAGASGVFAFVAFPHKRAWNLQGALFLLSVILAIPLSFFLAAQFLFQDDALSGLALINVRLYDALPFIVLAGLSVFPLVVVEGLLFALVVFVLAILGPVLAGRFEIARELTTLWVMVVILGIYAFAGMIQLNYMIALLRRASHDTLTGAFTRRSGMELLDNQFRTSVEQDLPLSVAFFDLDNFKSINDVHGHDAGDKVLRDAVAKLGRLLRQGDSVIRWGGEEFVVVMTGSSAEGVHIAMQRVMHEWLGSNPGGGPVTASIGVAERTRDKVEDWPQLVELADKRMYQSKTTGKARCTFTDEDVLLPA
ncbi:MAG: GGDEF domain-containing protein [Alphaproteobacteria bacterium]|nr:GGDEF domain-containing protein [Alphaproteobacteria bacterium]